MLGIPPQVINGVCTLMTVRNIPVTILGRPSRSAATIPMMFTFESMDHHGNALCLGETVILPEEINPFISMLRHYDILITALHNHWLFNRPGIMFIHFESIDNPIQFAHKVRHAISVLKH
ncbi:DUF1259 domain-containing protein [Brevibacillus choshinensis]|uniref:DUF1259 domain-containing protein n=1 Tax=Brevibacillus choshinensis TaxID=54911 RepID=UPI00399CBB97